MPSLFAEQSLVLKLLGLTLNVGVDVGDGDGDGDGDADEQLHDTVALVLPWTLKVISPF